MNKVIAFILRGVAMISENRAPLKKKRESLRLDPKPKSKLDEDLYGFKDGATRLKDRIFRGVLPQTIGLYGEWGSGKTTFKNFLLEEIEKDSKQKISTVDFNAWEHEKIGNIIFPMIKLLADRTGERGNERMKNLFATFSMSLGHVALRASTGMTLGLDDVLNFQEIAKKNIPQYSNYTDEIKKTRDHFKELREAVRKKERSEMVAIFIDELDRCNPENAVALLESIKNCFDVERCTFIILVDEGIISSYIDQKYQGTMIDGRQYLEKIIYYKLKIPSVPPETILNMFHGFGLNGVTLGICKKLFNPRKIRSLYEKCRIMGELYSSGDFPDEKPLFDIGDKISFLIILLYEAYPHLYESVSVISDSAWAEHADVVVNIEPHELTQEHRFVLDKIGIKFEDLGIMAHFFRTCKSWLDFTKYNRELLKFNII